MIMLKSNFQSKIYESYSSIKIRNDRQDIALWVPRSTLRNLTYLQDKTNIVCKLFSIAAARLYTAHSKLGKERITSAINL